ncbi:MAG: CARDB domain-containing protein [Candidatus Micrarchaeia archaeon]
MNATYKFAISTILLWMMLPVGLAIAQAAPSSSGALSIANLNISPNPIVAGENVTITLQLYNNYNYPLQNVNLELEGSYPLLNFSPSNSYLVSSMGQGLYGGVGSYMTYNLRVPSDAPTGVYTLDLVATYQTTSTTQSGLSSYSQSVMGESVMPISVYVQGIPNVSVTATSEGEVIPGSPFSLALAIQNTGGGEAKNLSINFQSTSNFALEGSSKFVIGKLPGGASAQAAVSYYASQLLPPGTYDIPVVVGYTSSSGTRYNSTFMLPISVVINQPDIVVVPSAALPQQLYQGYNQSLELLVENIGTGTAKNVSVSLSALNGTTIESSVNRFFISSIIPGESVPETVLVSTSNPNTATILASIGYLSGDYQNSYSKSSEINLNVAPTAQFQVVGIQSSLKPGDTNVPVTYTIKNTGDIAAEGISVTLQGIFPVTPVNGNAYISELLPGQETNVTFLVSIDSSAVPSNYPITLFEQWKQPNGMPNQEYAGSNNYYISIIGSTGGSNATYEGITLLIIVVIAIVAVAMRRKKSKQGKK